MNNLYTLGGDHQDTLFERIDEYGGWPLEWNYLIVRHTVRTKRPCYFSNINLHDEWNTARYSRDDYLWWKISECRKETIKQEHFKECKFIILRAI